MNTATNLLFCNLRVRLAVAAVALSAAVSANAGHRYDYKPVQVDVISDHRGAFAQYPVHSRAKDGEYRAYLEAMPEQNYSIRVRNHSGERIGVVIAVDGRNIISGKKSTLRRGERMYVLAPWETATYSGWRTASDRVNRFYFTEARDSYAAAFNDRSAMGVIAVAAFAQKHRYDDRDVQNERQAKGRSGPPSAAQESGSMADAQPGTGYGDSRYSPSRGVHFEAERQPMAHVFLKYEWRSMLCRKGIVACHREPRNRFWPRYEDNNGYAPAPYSGLRYRAPRPRSRVHSRYGG